jgi:hypothetical protein
VFSIANKDVVVVVDDENEMFLFVSKLDCDSENEESAGGNVRRNVVDVVGIDVVVIVVVVAAVVATVVVVVVVVVVAV